MKTPTQIEAIAATIGFVGLICFQVLLALGLPLRRGAWGGRYETLPTGKTPHVGKICEKPF
jgi:hypothetical protein